MNLGRIPSHMHESVRLYVERGVLPGEFLQAVVSNKLVESLLYADTENTASIRDWAAVLFDEFPQGSWGSEKRMLAWCAAGGLKGKAETRVGVGSNSQGASGYPDMEER